MFVYSLSRAVDSAYIGVVNGGIGMAHSSTTIHHSYILKVVTTDTLTACVIIGDIATFVAISCSYIRCGSDDGCLVTATTTTSITNTMMVSIIPHTYLLSLECL